MDSMKDLTYEQTVELEANVKIKKQADELYLDFLNYFHLDMKSFKDGKFKIWSDSHNATYMVVRNNTLIYQCRFLHETYDVVITAANLFAYIKSQYRGLEHFASEVKRFKDNRVPKA